VEDSEAIGSLDPSYSLYRTLAAIRNVPFVPSPLDDNFSWRKPVLETESGAKVSLFLLTNPNAPTGTVTPAGTIADFAKRFKGTVIVDEAYADFAKSNCVPLATAPDNRNLLVMRTFSKSFSLAGLRLGYCIGPEELIEALYKVKDSYNVDAVAQAVALAALNDLPWMRGNAAKVRRTRAHAAKELKRRGWDVLPSESNFLFARPAHRPAAELFEALRAKNIFVRYFKGPRTGDRLRITVGTDKEMATLLDALSTLDV
jgi:histidinol-phosphate aminotransferase